MSVLEVQWSTEWNAEFAVFVNEMAELDCVETSVIHGRLHRDHGGPASVNEIEGEAPVGVVVAVEKADVAVA